MAELTHYTPFGKFRLNEKILYLKWNILIPYLMFKSLYCISNACCEQLSGYQTLFSVELQFQICFNYFD